MNTSNSRRVTGTDYPLLRRSYICKFNKIVRKNNNNRLSKTWINDIDIDSVLSFIMDSENAWIVQDTYLVVYVIHTPWYNSGITILSEVLVARLSRQETDFSVVPQFLESKAREAGCASVSAGTALATSDQALASLYAKEGFQPECTILTKGLPMGDPFGVKKAANTQAKATTDAANMQANNDTLNAQAAAASTQTAIAQDKATQAATQLLSVPQQQVDVSLGSNVNDIGTIDTATGRRRTTRSRFNTPVSNSGIKL